MSWDSISETAVKRTRKEHVCIGCLQVIPAGSQMVRSVGKFEGELHDNKFCMACDNWIRENIVGSFEFSPGDIGEARGLSWDHDKKCWVEPEVVA